MGAYTYNFILEKVYVETKLYVQIPIKYCFKHFHNSKIILPMLSNFRHTIVNFLNVEKKGESIKAKSIHINPSLLRIVLKV